MKRLLTIIALSIAGFAVLATGAFYALAASDITIIGKVRNGNSITIELYNGKNFTIDYEIEKDGGAKETGKVASEKSLSITIENITEKIVVRTTYNNGNNKLKNLETITLDSLEDQNLPATEPTENPVEDDPSTDPGNENPPAPVVLPIPTNLKWITGESNGVAVCDETTYISKVTPVWELGSGVSGEGYVYDYQYLKPGKTVFEGSIQYSGLSSDKPVAFGSVAGIEGEWHFRVRTVSVENSEIFSEWSESSCAVTFKSAPLPPTNLKWITGESNKVIDESGNSTDEYRGTVSWDASPSKNVSKYIYVYWNDIEGSPYKVGSEWTSNINDSLEFNGEFNQGEGDHYFCVKAVNDDGVESVCSDTFKITYEVKEETPTKDYQLTVSGSVYQDKDGCVGKTTCESRLGNLGEGWVLNLYKEDSTGEEPVWNFIKSTTTDKEGKFKFNTRKGEGTYYVCQEEKAGWEQQEQTWSGSGYLVNTPNISGNELEGAYCRKVSFENIKNHSSTGQFGNVDIKKPTIEVKGKGNSHTPSSIIVGDFDNHEYIEVSFKLYDAGKIDRLTLNGVEKDLTNNQWSDLNYVKPGEFGAELGENTLVVFDVAGNSTTYVFTLVEEGNNGNNNGGGPDATGEQGSGDGESAVQGGGSSGGGGIILSSFAFGGSSEGGEVVGRVLGSTAFQFSKDMNIRINSVGPEVKALQIFLNENGFLVAESGPGSKGNETEFFGEKTRDAVIRFQEANDVILQRVEIYNNKGTGNFFWSTKQEANEMLLLNPDLSATILEIVEG